MTPPSLLGGAWEIQTFLFLAIHHQCWVESSQNAELICDQTALQSPTTMSQQTQSCVKLLQHQYVLLEQTKTMCGGKVLSYWRPTLCCCYVSAYAAPRDPCHLADGQYELFTNQLSIVFRLFSIFMLSLVEYHSEIQVGQPKPQRHILRTEMSFGPIWGKVVGSGLWDFNFPKYHMLLLNQQPLFKLQSHEHKISAVYLLVDPNGILCC